MNDKTINPPYSVSVDVARDLPWLQRDLGFVKVEDHFDRESNFGNSYAVYVAGDVKLRFVRDRGEILASVASRYRPTAWHILELVCEFISGQRAEKTTLPVLGALFRDNYEGIVRALGQDYFRIESQLEELDRKRLQEFWDSL